MIVHFPRRLLLIVSRRIFQRVVTGAGAPEVNGVYTQSQYFQGGFIYTKEGTWKNETFTFYIFQCRVCGDSKHWFISIVPDGRCSPVFSADIDFYRTPMTSDCRLLPPVFGWVKANHGSSFAVGVEPPPTISHMHHPNDNNEQDDHCQRRLEDATATRPSLDESMSSRREKIHF
jgi:hypothetical protein